MEVERGLPQSDRADAMEVFYAAFEAKLSGPLGADRVRAMEFLGRTLRSHNVILAKEGRTVMGILAFSAENDPVAADEFQVAKDIYGTLGALRRLALLAPMEHKQLPGALYVDSIAVSPEARGTGVGSLLLAEADAIALERGMKWVDLDVIDINPRARALYERLGYEVQATRSTGPLARLYGFKKYHFMRKSLLPRD